MSDSQERQPWSNNPHAPKIPDILHLEEKVNFAGVLIASMLYGITMVLFFQCMTGLFDSAHRRGERVKWGLVSYTAIMFSLVTILTAMNLHIQSIAYIDNREFRGNEGASFSGPLGYQLFTSREAISIIPSVSFTLSNWLADGLLLYSCYVIYSMNLPVIAFPCLMYLGSFATGITLGYQTTEPLVTNKTPWSGLVYLSILLSLNVLLTLMDPTVGTTGGGGFCQAIVTTLVESCAFYAVSSLLVIGPWGARNYSTNIFMPIFTHTQAIAPLLIIQIVANGSAFASNTVVSGHLGSFKERSRKGSTSDNGASPGRDPTNSVDSRGVGSGELGIMVETTIDFHQDKA